MMRDFVEKMVPEDTTFNERTCPVCKSSKYVVKYGRYTGIYFTRQIYFCKNCWRKFTGNKEFKHTTYPDVIIKKGLQLLQTLRPIDAHRELSKIFPSFKIPKETLFTWKKYAEKSISKSHPLERGAQQLGAVRDEQD